MLQSVIPSLSTRSLKLRCRSTVATEQGFMDIITSSGRNVFEAETFFSMSKMKRDRGLATTSIKSEHEVIGCLLLAVVAGIA